MTFVYQATNQSNLQPTDQYFTVRGAQRVTIQVKGSVRCLIAPESDRVSRQAIYGARFLTTLDGFCSRCLRPCAIARRRRR